MNPDIEDLIKREDFEGLINALSVHEDKSVRKHAASALGALGDSRAVELLIAALKEELVVRRRAPIPLGELSDNRAVDARNGALKDKEAIVRIKDAEAIGKISDSRVIKLLIHVLNDEVFGVEDSVY